MTEHTQPPEGFDPPKCDPVELDTVIDWRDTIDKLYKEVKGDGEDNYYIICCLANLRRYMNETIDTCHGLNDPEPEPPVDEDKMKALQHKEG